MLNTPCINFHVGSQCKIRKTTLDSSFLTFNRTSNSFYLRRNVPESTSHEPPKNHHVLQERVDTGESAEHQETDVNTTEEPDNTNSMEKKTNLISGKTAMST